MYQTKVINCYFMDTPTTTTAKDNRTWMVREDDEPYQYVRVYPDRDAPGCTKFVCDCADAEGRAVYLAYVDDADVCLHVKAVRDADAERFEGSK